MKGISAQSASRPTVHHIITMVSRLDHDTEGGRQGRMGREEVAGWAARAQETSRAGQAHPSLSVRRARRPPQAGVTTMRALQGHVARVDSSAHTFASGLFPSASVVRSRRHLPLRSGLHHQRRRSVAQEAHAGATARVLWSKTARAAIQCNAMHLSRPPRPSAADAAHLPLAAAHLLAGSLQVCTSRRRRESALRRRHPGEGFIQRQREAGTDRRLIAAIGPRCIGSPHCAAAVRRPLRHIRLS